MLGQVPGTSIKLSITQDLLLALLFCVICLLILIRKENYDRSLLHAPMIKPYDLLRPGDLDLIAL